jgi:hypothetical protein
VLSGSQPIEQLGRVQHTHIIASVADLPALIENISYRLGTPRSGK